MSEVLSDEGRKLSEMINFQIISFTVGLFGIVGNVINLIVFWKQGLSTTVNIAFFGLSISDLCCLILMVWCCICTNPVMFDSRVPWVTVDVAFLTASWPLVCFCRITSYITIYITAERYLSIAFPLKVKQMVTAKRTTIILFFIYFVNIFALVPEYASSYLGWRFVPKANRTLVALILNSNRGSVEGLENVLHSLLGMVSFIGIIIATVALVTKLRRSSQWRKEATSQAGALISREQKMVKMIVLVACVLIFCNTPGTIISLTTFIVGPDFNVLGRYYNILIAMWSIAYSCLTVNSSVNIILYYIMSSNYKRTLHDLVCKIARANM